MRSVKMLVSSFVVVFISICCPARAEEPATDTRTRDVIYGRKFGMALTMDVFAPKEKANGVGVIAVVSGGWFSKPENINPAAYDDCLNRGYTVFAVVHGSQPKFTLTEIIEDMHRAVRFVRYHARDYHIDPDRVGIFGGSAGGHLSLMIGTAGAEGDPKAPDPVDRVSSRVQAVACFFPPTDFLNWGGPGKEMINRSFRSSPPRSITTSTTRTRRCTCRSPTRSGCARSPGGCHPSRTSPPTTRRRSSSTATRTSWCRCSSPSRSWRSSRRSACRPS